MSNLEINLAETSGRYRPGQKVAGSAAWSLEREGGSVELRLFWYTRGKGTEDVQIIAQKVFSYPGRQGQQDFSFDLPDSPFSFSGKLVSVIWALELVALPGGGSARKEILVSPSGGEIDLTALPVEADES